MVDLGPPIDSEKWFLVVSVSFSLSLEIEVREMAVFLAAFSGWLGPLHDGAVGAAGTAL